MSKKEYRNMCIAIVAVFTLVCITISGASYAYFTVSISGSGKEVGATAATLKAEYSDGDAINATNIFPGWSVNKTITIKNTGTAPIKYTIKWGNLTNEFTDLKYTLSSTSSGAAANITTDTAVPTVDNTALVSNITLDSGATHTYTLTIKFPNLDKDQSEQMGKTFKATLVASGVQVS